MATLEFPGPYDDVLPHQIPLDWPATQSLNAVTKSRIVGSLLGLAVGDALGASVEFQPHEYLVAHPVHNMMSGGTWGLEAGQWTDDTSMALCLASSLLTQQGFNGYDQMVRYKWWYTYGYLSSTGTCFDIGNASRNSIEEFSYRQQELMAKFHINDELEVDLLPIDQIKKLGFNVNCSEPGVAGNGPLMRLAPVPLAFYRNPISAVELSGRSARLTHGDDVAVDACRYYAALIVAAIRGEPKESLLSNTFYKAHRSWFGPKDLHRDVRRIAAGSYKRQSGYDDGIRGNGYVLSSLEAALWAFWSGKSFEHGVLNAVNLGEDTDTVAAIYGQLAGAHYGEQKIPHYWKNKLYARDLIICIAKWLHVLYHPANGAYQIHKAVSLRSHSVASRARRMSTKIWNPHELFTHEMSRKYSQYKRAQSVKRYRHNTTGLYRSV